MAALPFRCSCGTVAGELSNAPAKGTHLVCYCDSCRAGANYCGASMAAGTPLQLYLTQPEHFKITQGLDQLAPFRFSPRAITRWQARCCGVQMFSTQADPKLTIMSIVAERLANADALGPLTCKAFVPTSGGKSRHEGKWALARSVFGALRAKLNGNWRKTQLFDVTTCQPIADVILVSKDDKRALLS